MQFTFKKIIGFFVFAALVLVLGSMVGACGSDELKCGSGSQNCNGSCTIITRDTNNCGACGTKCADGQVCSLGMCATACGGGTKLCGATCAATSNDPTNCGDCGKKCAANEVCSSGMCQGGCGAGLTQCGMSCVNVHTDRANCGGCGMLCPMGLGCDMDQCVLQCQQGFTKCPNTTMFPPPPMVDSGSMDSSMVDGSMSDASMDGSMMDASMMPDSSVVDSGPIGEVCVDLQNDDRHCGMCGQACPGNLRCAAGKCVPCQLCGGNKCIDVRNDANNCTSCGKVCGSGSCRNNQCCQMSVGKVYLQDDFFDASKKWTLDATWQIGKAVTGCFGDDVSADHTNAGDNGVAGVNLGGCAALNGQYFMTSAAFDASAANKVVISFWRSLESSSSTTNTVQVFDGQNWQIVNTGTNQHDGGWKYFSYDITQYKNQTMQVRFGYNSVNASSWGGWTVDDVLVAEEGCSP